MSPDIKGEIALVLGSVKGLALSANVHRAVASATVILDERDVINGREAAAYLAGTTHFVQETSRSRMFGSVLLTRQRRWRARHRSWSSKAGQ